jgi:hypothetical protein
MRLVQATSRFEAIHPLIKELALTGASKSMKPVASLLLPLSVGEASEGKIVYVPAPSFSTSRQNRLG